MIRVLLNSIPCLILLVIGYKFSDLRIIKAESESLPYSYFLDYGEREFNKDDYVLIEGLVTKYFDADTLFVKQVKGMPTATIANHKSEVFVDHKLVGDCLTETLNGEKLTKIALTEIPEDCAFVAGSHERSFDSRYEEFGVVPVSNITRKVIPLW
jgi:conjugal transfer pilin signal peptidase TrbI